MSRAALAALIAGGCVAAAVVELAAARVRTARRPGGLVLALTRLGRRVGAPAPPRDLAARIAAAGAPLGLGEEDVVALKAGAALAAPAALAPLAASAGARAGLLLALATAAGGYLAPDAYLRRRTAERARRMERELPDVLELVRVAVEAGLPLTRALAEVGRRRRGLLAAELRRAGREIDLGRPRAAALRGLAARAPAAGVPAFVAAVERAERLGAPLADSLSAQARDARAARAARLREAAERAAPKIQLVIALGLVPSVMLLVAAALLASLAR